MAKMTLPEFMRRLCIRYEISASRHNDLVALNDRDEVDMDMVCTTGQGDDHREFVINSGTIAVLDHDGTIVEPTVPRETVAGVFLPWDWCEDEKGNTWVHQGDSQRLYIHLVHRTYLQIETHEGSSPYWRITLRRDTDALTLVEEIHRDCAGWDVARWNLDDATVFDVTNPEFPTILATETCPEDER